MNQEHEPTRYEILLRKLYQTPLFRETNDECLENMKMLLRHLGLAGCVLGENPSIAQDPGLDTVNGITKKERIVFHVAGSNGKGSVCHKLALSLAYSGKFRRIGLFTSPHISCFRERIRIFQSDSSSSGFLEVLIPEDYLASSIELIFQICRRENISIAFFEVVTAIAFRYFYIEKAVDAIVLEVGLGGRLDATNVIKHPTISIITSISLEHTFILGNNLEAIAKEKAGIIKENPVVIGPSVPEGVVRTAVERNKTEFYTCDSLISFQDNEDFESQNSCIVSSVFELLRRQNRLQIPLEAISRGLQHRPPCRFETYTCQNGVTAVLDVSHNPSAINQFLRRLKGHFYLRSFRFVIGLSSDKDIQECLCIILDHANVKNIHLVESSTARAATIESMLDTCPSLKGSNYNRQDRTVTKQVQAALNLAQERNEVLVVCGSFFLMSETRRALGYNEPYDSDFVTVASGTNFNQKLKHVKQRPGEGSISHIERTS